MDIHDMKENGDAHTLTIHNMNQHVVQVQYAVRGPLPVRAAQITNELDQGYKKPYPYVIRCNIGDAHAMQQNPISFIRQVLASCTYPDLIRDSTCFPEDVRQRAQKLLAACSGQSIGSYTPIMGIDLIRQDIADFITRRDGYPSNVENIFLASGAADAIKTILTLFNNGDDGAGRPGIMIPIPQYPLYTATISEYNFVKIGYYLNEESNWGVDYSELKRAITSSKKLCQPRAIVVINPGNPTGQVLTKQDIRDIVEFAYEERLIILADEVYQQNVYAPGSEFHSFKKVINEMGPPYDKMELASFFSISKGYMGECGLRGGYCEMANFDPAVTQEHRKLRTAGYTASSISQIVMDIVVNPPVQGDESYTLYLSEKDNVIEHLSNKARLTCEQLNKQCNIACNTIQGAMYAFPRIYLPNKAIETAKQCGQEPDVFYCFQLLEEAGVCVIPGSGFGQKQGTYHFRITILPNAKLMKEMMERITIFNDGFMAKYK